MSKKNSSNTNSNKATTTTKAVEPTKGIVIVALGHPYYGNYAHQLAISIKFTTPSIPITLLHDGRGASHLTGAKLAHFDNVVVLQPSDYTTNGRTDYLRPKSLMNVLSPYDRTMWLDADMIALPRKSIAALFDELSGIHFTMSSRGAHDAKTAKAGFIHWADPQDVVKEYGIKGGVFYNVSSEFMYFEKGPKADAFFLELRSIYDNMLVPYKQFGNGMPDELAFFIALATTKTKLHAEVFLPCYWEPFHRRNLKGREMYDEFYFMSVGGAFQDTSTTRLYNDLAKFYCNKFGVEYPFPLRNKSKFLPERHSI